MNHGDFNGVFIGGDSSGANIVHNIAMRVGAESLHGGVKSLGAFLNHNFLVLHFETKNAKDLIKCLAERLETK